MHHPMHVLDAPGQSIEWMTKKRRQKFFGVKNLNFPKVPTAKSLPMHVHAHAFEGP